MEGEPLGQELSDQDRVLLVFGYLGPLALVSLVASRRDFVKWHAKQGLALALTFAAGYLVLIKPLRWIAERWLYGLLSEVFWAASWATVLGLLFGALVCIVRGLEGERFKLPFLGELADRL